MNDSGAGFSVQGNGIITQEMIGKGAIKQRHFVPSPTQPGDMYYGYDGNAFANLPIGSAGQLLRVVSGKPAWSNQNGQTLVTLTPAGAGTATIDLSLSTLDYRITMPAGNITIALSNVTVGRRFSISLTQDSGGSRTVTWFTTIRWPGGSAPALTTTANKRDWFEFLATGTATFDASIKGQNL